MTTPHTPRHSPGPGSDDVGRQVRPARRRWVLPAALGAGLVVTGLGALGGPSLGELFHLDAATTVRGPSSSSPEPDTSTPWTTTSPGSPPASPTATVSPEDTAAATSATADGTRTGGTSTATGSTTQPRPVETAASPTPGPTSSETPRGKPTAAPTESKGPRPTKSPKPPKPTTSS